MHVCLCGPRVYVFWIKSYAVCSRLYGLVLPAYLRYIGAATCCRRWAALVPVRRRVFLRSRVTLEEEAVDDEAVIDVLSCGLIEKGQFARSCFS